MINNDDGNGSYDNDDITDIDDDAITTNDDCRTYRVKELWFK